MEGDGARSRAVAGAGRGTIETDVDAASLVLRGNNSLIHTRCLEVVSFGSFGAAEPKFLSFLDSTASPWLSWSEMLRALMNFSPD
jgi:hypothetical protein